MLTPPPFRNIRDLLHHAHHYAVLTTRAMDGTGYPTVATVLHSLRGTNGRGWGIYISRVQTHV